MAASARRAILALVALGCADPRRTVPTASHEVVPGPVALSGPVRRTGPLVSTAAVDRVSRALAVAALPLPVEAKFFILAGDGTEPELAAIRAALDYRGTPYEVFVATTEAPLTGDRLASGDHGFYQATVLTDSALAVGGASALEAEEWTALADYEARFHVRRAVLNAYATPLLGFGPATTSTEPVSVSSTAEGRAVFRDVNWSVPQEIRNTYVYLAAATDATHLVPLLTDPAGNTLAAVHHGDDGRETLLLTFANNSFLPHSLTFLHGTIDWVSGGTYLGDRRILLSAQVDDLFLASDLWGGGVYRLDERDMEVGVAWQKARRLSALTTDFRVAFAFNGKLAQDEDELTETVKTQRTEWHWMSHTYSHPVLDGFDYPTAFSEFALNRQTAQTLGLDAFDGLSIVTPGVTGLMNPEVMRAAIDNGIRFAVTDTSRAGCDNPTPNTAFYDAAAPSVLLMPRRPTNLFYNVSTPEEWTAEYNTLHRDVLKHESSYAQVIDQESDVLVQYLLRGETDPWMFHQANLRAYDGVHSLLGDLVDATVAKFEKRLAVPILTPPMQDVGRRFSDRMKFESGGVRATLLRGQALLIDVAKDAPVPVTGLAAPDGEINGADRAGVVMVVAGATACIPLDSARQGCTPAPVRAGGAGASRDPATGQCNASNANDPGEARNDDPDAGEMAGEPGAGASPTPHHGGCCNVAARAGEPEGSWLFVAIGVCGAWFARRSRRRRRPFNA